MGGLVLRQHRLNRRVVDAGVKGDRLGGGSARSAAGCEQPKLEQGREPDDSASAPHHVVTVIPVRLPARARGGLSAERWIDMDLGAGAGRLRPFPSEHGANLLEADGGGYERPGIDGTSRVRRDGG